ncbi:MAG TPA: MgtC/SapB family protein, partial [Vicinamibacteria bacterium]|nr:MgtC/SapB family protein [Vicinamibacteria bacterium]
HDHLFPQVRHGRILPDWCPRHLRVHFASMGSVWDQLVRELRLELLVQLLLAVVFGGAVGVERELRGKPAGLRTNILICVGATLFTVLSFRMAEGRGDPGRVAAQVLTGVGFIGAGTILHLRGSVTGLTSAATIWVVAAVGMAVGARAYVEAGGATLLIMMVLAGLSPLEGFLARQGARSHFTVHCRPEAGAVDELEALVRRTGLELERLQSRLENVDLVVELDVRGPKRLHDQLLIAAVHQGGVRSVSTGE